VAVVVDTARAVALRRADSAPLKVADWRSRARVDLRRFEFFFGFRKKFIK
jgi:hypothetical protein